MRPAAAAIWLAHATPLLILRASSPAEPAFYSPFSTTAAANASRVAPGPAAVASTAFLSTVIPGKRLASFLCPKHFPTSSSQPPPDSPTTHYLNARQSRLAAFSPAASSPSYGCPCVVAPSPASPTVDAAQQLARRRSIVGLCCATRRFGACALSSLPFASPWHMILGQGSPLLALLRLSMMHDSSANSILGRPKPRPRFFSYQTTNNMKRC